MTSTVPAWPSGRPPVGQAARSGVPRPIYREPAPARPGSVLLGAGTGALWMMLFGMLAHSTGAYVWWTATAAAGGWIAAVVLARMGDRGIATGVAIASGFGLAVAVVVIMLDALHGHWVL